MVKGPLCAIIVTLKAIDWVPLRPAYWQDGVGNAWTFAAAVRFDLLAKQLGADVHKFLCRQSKGPWCDSASEGFDAWSLQHFVPNLDAKGNVAHAGIIRSIAAGGFATREKLSVAQRSPDAGLLPLYRVCGQVPETAVHYFYTCPMIPSMFQADPQGEKATIQGVVHKHIKDSQYLVEGAKVGCIENQQCCFYLCGLLPSMTHYVDPESP